jgi:hypothetical protein
VRRSGQTKTSSATWKTTSNQAKNPNKSHLPIDWPSKKDIYSLVRKSSGQFIYAATVIKFLSSGKRIKARLRSILDVGSTSINGQDELPFRQLMSYMNIFLTLQDLDR